MQPKIFSFAIASFLLTSCGTPPEPTVKALQAPSPEEPVGKYGTTAVQYTLQKPSASWKMPNELVEISGNAWVDDTHMLAIEDEQPNLYLVRLDKEAVIEKTIPFAPESIKNFDLEDVAFYDNTAYALWSHGTIYQVEDWQASPRVRNMETGLKKADFTEAICYDPVMKRLLVAYRLDPGITEENDSRSVIYRLDSKTGKVDDQPVLQIDKKDFGKGGEKRFSFHPSAIAVHPLNGDIYVLSNKNTMGLAYYSHDGKFKGFYELDEELLPQPQGMCIAPDGTLFISTEGNRNVPAKIYRYDAIKVNP
jgi:hypothetical protein